ncbi:MAG: hypothetical protein ABI321_05085 [Polyangia bacterium]
MLKIGEPMRRRLARLRWLEPGCGPSTLDIELVRNIERTLACRIDDDALAILASGVTDLVHDAGMDAKRVVERTNLARTRGCPPELVALGGHPAGQEFYCISPNRPEGDPLLMIEYSTKDGSLVARTIVEWTEARLEIRRDVLLNGDPAERRLASKAPSAALILEFQPSLVVLQKAAQIVARRVQHPTFGEGEVLAEIGQGENKKLNVRFSVGDKLLLERVLRDVEG